MGNAEYMGSHREDPNLSTWDFFYLLLLAQPWLRRSCSQSQLCHWLFSEVRDGLLEGICQRRRVPIPGVPALSWGYWTDSFLWRLNHRRELGSDCRTLLRWPDSCHHAHCCWRNQAEQL